MYLLNINYKHKSLDLEHGLVVFVIYILLQIHLLFHPINNNNKNNNIHHLNIIIMELNDKMISCL